MRQNAFETLLDILFTNTGKHFKGLVCNIHQRQEMITLV